MSDSDDDSVVKLNPRVQSEYNEWKKKCPFFYDFIISHPLPRTSLTVHWSTMTPLTHSQVPSLALHRLLFNTYYPRARTSYLTIANAALPAIDHGPIPTLPKVEITHNIALDSRLAMARFMPQNPHIVCARTQSTDVYVFDCTKPHKNDQLDPDLTLTSFDENVIGHGGAGLAWHQRKEGYILSSNGHSIAYWDVSAVAQRSKVLDPIHVFDYFKDTGNLIQEVQWNCKNENVFGSVDKNDDLVIWDLRTDKSQHSAKAQDVDCLSFNPFNEWFLAIASVDATVGLFDMRKLTEKLFTLAGHRQRVYKVEWNPNLESVLASSSYESYERRVIIWDINRIGDETLKGDSKAKAKRPPELLFYHEGHKDEMTDFSWNHHEPWVISSVAKDHTLQLWKLAQSIVRHEHGGHAIGD
ncbi:WD repeat containing protein [Parasponia andersonii]|uniref:WD repeat containing protein n=1 Tax=Parasponia andersonii TaxID=3476 RepID=A0A2P5C9R4_PARAD|nr:WD repeat containing protein [Parasponia andersonii]